MFWIDRRTALACTTALALAGCSDRPAGLEPLNFGAATAHNTAVMTGQIDYRVALARRFADEVPSTVTFGFNSAVLDAQARSILAQQARWIKQFPELEMRIYGHTDLVGSASYNRALGLRRARAVARYLRGLGVKQSRLDVAVSQGETQPLVVTEGREPRNRRTVTEVSGFVRGHPSVMNGKLAELLYRDYTTNSTAEPEGTLGDAAPK